MAYRPDSQEEAFDYLFKLVLIGDAGVGKTCVVQRFMGSAFVDRHSSTIGVDFTMRTVVIDGKRVKVTHSLFCSPLWISHTYNKWLMLYTRPAVCIKKVSNYAQARPCTNSNPNLGRVPCLVCLYIRPAVCIVTMIINKLSPYIKQSA